MTAAAFSPKGDMLLLWEIGTLGIYKAIDCQKEPAWELSRVETVTERIEKESRFDQLLRLADEALSQKDIPAALAALREADGVPGMEGNGALLDLWRRAGKYCRIGGVRRVGRPYPLADRLLDDHSQPLHPAGVRVAFSFETRRQADGEACVTLLEVYDATTGARICVHDQPYCSAKGSAVALSPCGEYAYRLTASAADTGQRDNGWSLYEYVYTLHRFALRTGRCEKQTTVWKSIGREDFVPPVKSLAVSSDGNALAAFVDQPRKQTLLLIDAQSGETRTSFPVTGWRWARFLPGDKRLLAGCMEGQYQVFSLETWECEASFALNLESEHVVDEKCFDVSGDGCFVALSSVRGQVTAARVLYEYDFPGWQDDDERLSPFPATFQRLHPQWTDADFDALMDTLGRNGLGFIRPEAVRKRLVRRSPHEKPLLASLWEQHPGGAPKGAPRPNPRSAGVPIARPLPPLQPTFPAMLRVPQPSAQKPPQPAQKPSTPLPVQKPPQKPAEKKGFFGLFGRKK